MYSQGMQYDAATDGQLQVLAGIALLEHSRLVEWRVDADAFRPVAREAFEFSWRKDVDPVFGRLVCWMAFSAGAEFLAKGICLMRGVEIRDDRPVPAYPTTDIDSWPTRFLSSPSDGFIDATHFGTLWNLTRDNHKTKTKAALVRLCEAVSATATEKDLLLATYELLKRSIRNRDAHAYVPNVRDAHYELVPALFSRCFNLLVSWLPDGAPTLNGWRANAGQFIASL